MSAISFEPVAIVGQSCVFPGALTPDALWDGIVSGTDFLTDAPSERWRIAIERAVGAGPDRATSCRGGFVNGFQEVFQPHLYGVPAHEVLSLDRLVQWSLHAAGEALASAGLVEQAKRLPAGLVLGNLSLPSQSLFRLAEMGHLDGRFDARTHSGMATFDNTVAAHPINRFMSGWPAMYVARLLGLSEGGYALDAACASSIYAIKHACDRLHDRRADIMLAGGVNAADNLFVQIGFSALSALSPSGMSRPFHQDADGLVPSEGAAFVVLRRLADAVAAGDRILGVVRGIGVSNDGRGEGFLAPSTEGQTRAMLSAYEVAGISPTDVSLVECHAAGTRLGDLTELTSMTEVFRGAREIAIGSIKSNIGHLVTAAGMAGLLKLLAAMRHNVLPPMRPTDRPVPALQDTPFSLIEAPGEWNARSADGAPRMATGRFAGLNAFGFGGNNAHLILEQWRGQGASASPKAHTADFRRGQDEIVVVGIGASVANRDGREEFARALFGSETALREDAEGYPGGLMEELIVPLEELRFPPNDLRRALPQQLLMLKVAMEAVKEVDRLDGKHAGAFIGMQCDATIGRYGLRWRLAEWAPVAELDSGVHVDPAWIQAAREEMGPALDAAGVVGRMPNILANRINNYLDFRGCGYTLSAEQASGIVALDAAIRALRAGELNAALVGAVDLCCEPVHRRCGAMVLRAPERIPGDAAVALVLKRMADAQRDGDMIYGSVSVDVSSSSDSVTGEAEVARWTSDKAPFDLVAKFGHAHAASGLMHVIAALLACHYAAVVRQDQSTTLLVARKHRPQVLAVDVSTLGGTTYHASVKGGIADVSVPGGDRMDASSIRSAYRDAVAAIDDLSGALRHGGLRAAAHPGALPLVRLDERVRIALMRASMAPGNTSCGPGVRPAAQYSSFSEHFAEERAMPRCCGQQMPGLAVPATGTSPETCPVRDEAAAPSSLQSIVASHSWSSPTLLLSRAQLEALASGSIASVLGPLFSQQDGFTRQVRLPMPPLLLVDRVTGIDGVPGSMGMGKIRTETDIHAGAWYLHSGRMPAGVMIEAGQADLLLLSWLGVDFRNKGQRVYRLLGCNVTFHGELPRAGETITFEIAIDGYARHQDVELCFFHYDGFVSGVRRLSVTAGCAGFFTDHELANAGGVLWDATTAKFDVRASVAPPIVDCRRNSFDDAAVAAFSEGRLYECFGEGFENARTHTDSPRIPGGRLRLIDRVTSLRVDGGPWRRGYLRAELAIASDHWFFDGHFLNDPCMPGTLMSEGCFQAMAFYLGALGYTLSKDGYRFEPAPEQTFQLQCRAQVTPRSRLLVYEVFVEELRAGAEPMLYADVLCTVDSVKAFHCRRLACRLVRG